MRLWIDGDAFPNALKPMLVKTINRVKVQTTLVANKSVHLGDSDYIHYIQVGMDADEADKKIVELVEEGDLVITADIPLADRVLEKKAFALDQRGKWFTIDNIKSFLAMRELMQGLRDLGEIGGGPAPIGPKDVHQFVNALSHFFQKHGA